MKDLIIKALDEAFELFKRKVPQARKKEESLDISHVSPFVLPSFLKENNVPNNAYFSYMDSGKRNTGTYLCWEVEPAPMTEEDRLTWKRQNFTSVAWSFVVHVLTKDGYKHRNRDYWLATEYPDATIYDLYIAKDFDRLVEYYSLQLVEKGVNQ